MGYRARVYVTPKEAVLDPQGKAIASSLNSMGYSEVDDVRLGKYLVLTLSAPTSSDASARVDEMCRRLLANDIIEDFRFEVEEAG